MPFWQEDRYDDPVGRRAWSWRAGVSTAGRAAGLPRRSVSPAALHHLALSPLDSASFVLLLLLLLCSEGDSRPTSALQNLLLS